MFLFSYQSTSTVSEGQSNKFTENHFGPSNTFACLLVPEYNGSISLIRIATLYSSQFIIVETFYSPPACKHTRHEPRIITKCGRTWINPGSLGVQNTPRLRRVRRLDITIRPRSIPVTTTRQQTFRQASGSDWADLTIMKGWKHSATAQGLAENRQSAGVFYSVRIESLFTILFLVTEIIMIFSPFVGVTEQNSCSLSLHVC